MTRDIRKGFSLVELLVVMSIIGMLVAIAIPGLNLAKFKAKEGSLRMKLNTISSALESFNGDQGFYPQSSIENALIDDKGAGSTDGVINENDPTRRDRHDTYIDTGAHRLVRALMGADGLGYQQNGYYAVDSNTGQPVDSSGKSAKRNNYLDTEGFEIKSMNVNGDAETIAAKVEDVSGTYDTSTHGSAWLNTNPVIRDDLTRNSMPILYYKANKRNYLMASADKTGIYNYSDNSLFTEVTGMDIQFSLSGTVTKSLNNFAYYIWDTNSGQIDGIQTERAKARPSKKDSFILITAGKDGKYGTADDISSFDFKTGKNQ